MPRTALTGTRIRERRTVLGLKQADLAMKAQISASYLNLIEHNRRRIGGGLLNRIAGALSVDVAALTQGAEAAQIDTLTEAAAGSPELGVELDRIDEFVGRFPGWVALVAALQRKVGQLENQVASLADRLDHDPFLSASLHDLLTRASAIQSTASILAETDDLNETWTRRFHRNLVEDSGKLAVGASRLAAYLDSDGQVAPGLLTPQEELESFLNRTGFHIAGLEGPVPDLIDALIAGEPTLRSASARALARVHMAGYRADALALPLAPFEAAAAELGYDPMRLASRFDAPVMAVLRRLATLPAPGQLHTIGLVACDGAGALTLRKGADLIPAPRFGAACPLWPLYDALAQPFHPVRAVLEHASRPGQKVLAFALAELRHPEGFDGPAIRDAVMVLIPTARVALPVGAGPVRIVGSSCRVCAVADCMARREPSILADGFDSGAQIAP